LWQPVAVLVAIKNYFVGSGVQNGFVKVIPQERRSRRRLGNLAWRRDLAQVNARSPLRKPSTRSAPFTHQRAAGGKIAAERIGKSPVATEIGRAFLAAAAG